MARWYKGFLVVDLSSNAPQVIIFGGCVKLYPVALGDSAAHVN